MDNEIDVAIELFKVLDAYKKAKKIEFSNEIGKIKALFFIETDDSYIYFGLGEMPQEKVNLFIDKVKLKMLDEITGRRDKND